MPKDLTALAVSSAKPRSARYELADGAARGLRLVVQPSGAKSWAVRYRRQDGTTAKLTLGPCPALDLRTARAKAHETMSAVGKGIDPNAAKKADRAAAKAKSKPDVTETTAAAIESFITRHAMINNRAGVARQARQTLKRELAPWLGRRLAEIKSDDIHGILDGKVGAGKPIAANRTLAVLRRFFRFAVERRIVSVSPCAGIGTPAPTKTRERVLSIPELQVVWRASERLGHPFGPIVQLLILTGQRRGEVAAITERDFDPAKLTWTIPADIAKNKQLHHVHLAPPALDILIEAVTRGRVADFLFGTTTPPSGWSKAKRRLDQLVGGAILKPWTLHDLRRSVATSMAESGVAVPVVDRLLNHVSGSFKGVLGTYQRQTYLPERRIALEAWSKNFVRMKVIEV